MKKKQFINGFRNWLSKKKKYQDIEDYINKNNNILWSISQNVAFGAENTYSYDDAVRDLKKRINANYNNNYNNKRIERNKCRISNNKLSILQTNKQELKQYTIDDQIFNNRNMKNNIGNKVIFSQQNINDNNNNNSTSDGRLELISLKTIVNANIDDITMNENELQKVCFCCKIDNFYYRVFIEYTE